MNENIHTLSISLNLFIFCVIILSKRSSCADYRYEECAPSRCENGPKITFPFYIPDQQESYCGYPGIGFINCSHNGFPVLHLPGNDFVVEDIFYATKSLRVINPAFSSLNASGCVPRIETTTLPTRVYSFADNVTELHLFSNCTNPLHEGVLMSCGDWAFYETDESFVNASERCGRNVVVPVEERVEDVNLGRNGVVEVLRRGFVLNWTASDCIDCESSGGRCGFNRTTFLFWCFCPAGPHSRSCPPRKTRFPLILVTSFAVVLIVLAFIVTLIMLIKRAKKKKRENDYNHKKIEIFLKNYGNFAPKRYKYSQLKKMTKSFSDNLGKGGYGSVYKGKLPDNRLVAVKLLNESKKNGEDFVNEVASISRTSHINIVTLLGFCFEGSKRALIYECMPNGSLDKFISIEGHLGWEKLFEIAVGIARGLEYLHRGCNMRILHLDIKPQNILLDKDFHPKIADFGLAKLCPDMASIVSMTGARGTVGYIAPEVCCRNFGEVSHKSDVYSYGMMVMEIVGERRNVDLGVDENMTEAYFPYWVYKHLEVDSNEEDRGGVVEDSPKRKLTIVGLWCIQTDPNDRPSMRRVVEMLEGKLECVEIPPKPYLSSPTRSAVEVSTFESSI